MSADEDLLPDAIAEPLLCRICGKPAKLEIFSARRGDWIGYYCKEHGEQKAMEMNSARPIDP